MNNPDPDEIERLSQSATESPWMVDSTVALGAYGVWRDGTTLRDDEPMEQVCSVLCNEMANRDRRNANAALIVYLRNHASEIVAEIRKLAAIRAICEPWLSCHLDPADSTGGFPNAAKTDFCEVLKILRGAQ